MVKIFHGHPLFTMQLALPTNRNKKQKTLLTYTNTPSNNWSGVLDWCCLLPIILSSRKHIKWSRVCKQKVHMINVPFPRLKLTILLHKLGTHKFENISSLSLEQVKNSRIKLFSVQFQLKLPFKLSLAIWDI